MSKLNHLSKKIYRGVSLGRRIDVCYLCRRLPKIQCTTRGRLGQSPYGKLEAWHPPHLIVVPFYLPHQTSTQISWREDAEAPSRGHGRHLPLQHIFLYSPAGILTSIGSMTAHSLTCSMHLQSSPRRRRDVVFVRRQRVLGRGKIMRVCSDDA
jgi:hypothetical protein